MPEGPPGAEPGVIREYADAMSKVFQDPQAALQQDSLVGEIQFKSLGDILAQQPFQDALEAACSGDYSPALEYLKTLANLVDALSFTVNLKTADDKIVPLSVGLSEFDYVPGEEQWWDLDQLRHNKYFIQFQLRQQDWQWLNQPAAFRFEFKPKDRQSGEPWFGLQGTLDLGF